MKAKKIVPRIIATSQEQLEAATKADARRKRELNRSSRLLLDQTISGLAALDPADYSESRRKETARALFDVIAEANKAVLKLTGSPGIITQGELERVMTARDVWCHNRVNGLPAEFPAAWSPFLQRLNQLVNDGWLTEPGPLSMCGGRVSLNVGRRKAGASYAPRLEHPDAPAPRQAESETPSVETLQAWFDLPSDRPPAESSPAAS
jgi:hypothetical protein